MTLRAGRGPDRAGSSDTMTDHHDTEHRHTHEADPGRVTLRDVDDAEGMFAIRMPVTSTAEARDGIAFDREKVEGFGEQIENERIPLFLDHGRNAVSGSHYSALGKVGYLDAPELEENDGQTELLADYVLPDPATLDEDVGPMREALAWIRTQAERGIPIASSIGWDEDTGSRELPGDADLMESSIVGIPSDPRTTTASAEPATLARAVSAASSDFDVDAFVRAYRSQDQGDEVGESDGDDLPDPDRDTATDDGREETDMTDDTDTDSADSTDGDGTDRDGQDGTPDEEWRDEMLEMQRQQTETLSALADTLREDDEDEDEDDDNDDEDEDGENAADTDGTEERRVTIDGEERTVSEALDELRDAVDDADPDDAESQTANRAADDDVETVDEDDDTQTTGFGFAGAEDN